MCRGLQRAHVTNLSRVRFCSRSILNGTSVIAYSVLFYTALHIMFAQGVCLRYSRRHYATLLHILLADHTIDVPSALPRFESERCVTVTERQRP